MDNNMENNKVVIDFEVISAVFMTIIMMAVIAVVVGVGTVGAVSLFYMIVKGVLIMWEAQDIFVKSCVMSFLLMVVAYFVPLLPTFAKFMMKWLKARIVIK